jgi:hypothetical protein
VQPGQGHCVVVTTDIARFKLVEKQNWRLGNLRVLKKMEMGDNMLSIFQNLGGTMGWGPLACFPMRYLY